MFLEQEVEFSQVPLPPAHQIRLDLPVVQMWSCGVIDKTDQSRSLSLQGDGIAQDDWKEAGTWEEFFF